MANKNVIFWADNSDEAKNIKISFENKGYTVNHIFTASSLPVVKSNKIYYSGVHQIKTNFCL